MDRKKDFIRQYLVEPNYILVDVKFFPEFEDELTDRMVYIRDRDYDYVIQNMKILKVLNLGCDFKIVADYNASF